jgi:hypothetical protein
LNPRFQLPKYPDSAHLLSSCPTREPFADPVYRQARLPVSPQEAVKPTGGARTRKPFRVPEVLKYPVPAHLVVSWWRQVLNLVSLPIVRCTVATVHDSPRENHLTRHQAYDPGSGGRQTPHHHVDTCYGHCLYGYRFCGVTRLLDLDCALRVPRVPGSPTIGRPGHEGPGVDSNREVTETITPEYTADSSAKRRRRQPVLLTVADRPLRA